MDIDFLKRRLRADPTDMEAALHLSNSLRRQGRLSEAKDFIPRERLGFFLSLEELNRIDFFGSDSDYHILSQVRNSGSAGRLYAVLDESQVNEYLPVYIRFLMTDVSDENRNGLIGWIIGNEYASMRDTPPLLLECEDFFIDFLERIKEPDNAKAFCFILGRLKSKRAIKAIARFLEIGDYTVVFNAAWALGNIGSEEGVSYIRRSLDYYCFNPVAKRSSDNSLIIYTIVVHGLKPIIGEDRTLPYAQAALPHLDVTIKNILKSDFGDL